MENDVLRQDIPSDGSQALHTSTYPVENDHLSWEEVQPSVTSSIRRQHPADDILEIVSPGAAAIIAEDSETSLEASVKRRTRRILRPVLQGNNPHGRTGKMSCRSCRTWKRKCVYDALELPCELCKERGLKCGYRDKVFGPRREQRRTPGFESRYPDQSALSTIRISVLSPGEAINPLDSSYLGNFLHWHTSTNAAICSDFSYLPVKWASYPIDSKPFRFAVLACASSAFTNQMGRSEVKEHAAIYLQKSYSLVRRAAATGAFRDVVYSSFMLFVYEFLRPIEDHNCEAGFYHCMGMWNSLNALKETLEPGASMTEVFFMETLWACALRTQYVCINRHSAPTTRIFALLRATTDMLDWHKTADRIYHRIHCLSIHLRMYMHYYLLQRNGAVMSSTQDKHFIKSGLEKVCTEIVLLGPRILEVHGVVIDLPQPDRSDLFPALLDRRPPTPSEIWGINILYYLAVIAKHIVLSQPSELQRQIAIDGAISLCSLYVPFSEAVVDYRELELKVMGLFIAGLVLAQSQNLELISWINEEFAMLLPASPENPPSLSVRPRAPDLKQLFSAFLKAAQNCPSVYDIWVLKAGGVSIDRLYSGLAPRVGAVSVGLENTLFWLV